jgi:hypothetical protein
VKTPKSDRNRKRGGGERREEGKRRGMRIGIVGSGKVGGTLTRRFREIGHDVAVANRRGPDSLRPLADQTGATAGTVTQVAEKSDVIVLAIPTHVVPELPGQAFDGKIVVDANNYFPDRDGEIEPIVDRAVSSSRWVADHFPGARVVKAFNAAESAAARGPAFEAGIGRTGGQAGGFEGQSGHGRRSGDRWHRQPRPDHGRQAARGGPRRRGAQPAPPARPLRPR